MKKFILAFVLCLFLASSAFAATASKQLTITINAAPPPPLEITTVSCPDGQATVAYTGCTLQSTGGSGTTRTWSVTSGQLPPGLSLSANGLISGTPTQPGMAIFTVTVSDGVTTASIEVKAIVPDKTS